ncbi:MAG: hypothetical protein RSD99_15150, partial [Janthinobacterium sp.]
MIQRNNALARTRQDGKARLVCDGETRAPGTGSAETARYKNTTGACCYAAFHQSFHAHLTNPARL